MAWLLIFDYLEILQAWRIYEYNVIQWWMCQNCHRIKNNEWCNITQNYTMYNLNPTHIYKTKT